MGRRKKLRDLIGILKDKASLIKATLSAKRTTSSIHVAVLRATTHSSTSPPPEHRLATILSRGQDSRTTACACIEIVMDRLHSTRNACVALKCLITLHSIVTRGSLILKDQLSFYPSSGGHNFLNLSMFRDKADMEALEFSSWVRWYAGVLERNLITSRALGCYFSSSSSIKIDIEQETDRLSSSLNLDLQREIAALVDMVEEICRVPESLHFQKNNLVYEIVKLVGEDYRMTQYQIIIRLDKLCDRISGLSHSESAELISCFERLEGCKERLVALFVNRNRNVAFWDLISRIKTKLVKTKEETEREWSLVKVGKKEESTRFGERVGGPSQLLRLLPYGSNWSSIDQVSLTVS